MESPNWEPINQDEAKDWRKHLDKGAIRETRAAYTDVYQGLDPDPIVSIKQPATIQEAAVPREVAEDVFGMMWDWGRKSPEAYALMVQIMRNSNPGAFAHLSDDELRTKIEQHARDAARKATEEVYAKQWDKGNDLDMWQNKPLVYSNDPKDLIVVEKAKEATP